MKGGCFVMIEGTQYKAYVDVTVDFIKGLMLPRTIIWRDGSRYAIDKVIDIRPSFAAKAGGQGDRYTVRIGDNIRYLFFERSACLSGNSLGEWFVEKTTAC